jgi:DNA repair photolyase
MAKIKTGTREWADNSLNITKGCPNNCIYCYSAESTRKAGKDWTKQTKEIKVNIKEYYNKVNGVIMFPTKHDITEFNIIDSIEILKTILKAGNDVLIVSKPRLDVIKKLLEELKEYKNNVEIRFSIGTLSEEDIKFFEPGASSILERFECLEIVKKYGYKLSVSAEPLLTTNEEDTSLLIKKVLKIADKIWIGKLNKPNDRIIEKDTLSKEKILKVVSYLENDENVLKLYNKYKDNKNVEWKDSIKEVLNNRLDAK